MPPVAQQGSRAGIVTALVVFVILAVAAGGFAVYYGIENGKAKEKLATLETTNNALVGDMSDNDVSAIKDKAGQGGVSVIHYLQDEQKKALDVIRGAGNEVPGITNATEAQNAVQTAANTAVTLLNLNGVHVDLKAPPLMIKQLADAVMAERQNEIAARASADASEKRRAEAEKQNTADVNKQKAEFAALNLEKDKALQELKTAQGLIGLDVKEAMKQYQKQLTQALEAEASAKTELLKQQAANNLLVVQVDDMTKRLQTRRMETNAAGMGIAAARINKVERVANGSFVYLDIGQGDQVSPGMTFEVYGADDGVPKIKAGEGATDDALPIGKASIEIDTVIGPHSSRARVVNTQPGATVGQGDLVANLIYNKNVKFNFTIYAGDGFDLNNNGHIDPGAVLTLQRMVTDWGGVTSDKITIDTDFLVMGKEPVVIKADPNDPKQVLEQKLAQDRLDAYEKVKGQALDLHIPIMNQNRFLYYIGFYDRAKTLAER